MACACQHDRAVGCDYRISARPDLGKSGRCSPRRASVRVDAARRYSANVGGPDVELISALVTTCAAPRASNDGVITQRCQGSDMLGNHSCPASNTLAGPRIRDISARPRFALKIRTRAVLERGCAALPAASSRSPCASVSGCRTPVCNCPRPPGTSAAASRKFGRWCADGGARRSGCSQPPAASRQPPAASRQPPAEPADGRLTSSCEQADLLPRLLRPGVNGDAAPEHQESHGHRHQGRDDQQRPRPRVVQVRRRRQQHGGGRRDHGRDEGGQTAGLCGRPSASGWSRDVPAVEARPRPQRHDRRQPCFVEDGYVNAGGAEVENGVRRQGYSHSIVPGGLDVTSRTTRFTSRTSLVIRVEIRSSTS